LLRYLVQVLEISVIPKSVDEKRLQQNLEVLFKISVIILWHY
jgi:diketogulonate reductase-like aldo/keto reductase